MATTPKPLVKNMFSERTRVISPEGIKPAKQEFKDDADLNSIMRKFQKTGAMDHFAQYQEQYGEIGPADLQTALNQVMKADQMFNELPSSVRNRFDNSPQDFLSFVQNPDNYEEAKQLNIGLSPEAEAIALSRIPPEPPPEPQPAPDPVPPSPEPTAPV